MSIIFTFCVSGSNYVSASSQDGRSPVWARPLAHVPEGMGKDIRVTSAFLMHDFVSCLPDIRPWPKYRPCRRLWAISLLYPTPKSAHESQIHHRPLPQKFERGCRRCWYTCQGLRHTISQFCFSYILGPVLVWCPRWTYFFCRVQWPACLSLGWREGSPTVTVWARSQSMRGIGLTVALHMSYMDNINLAHQTFEFQRSTYGWLWFIFPKYAIWWDP